MKSKDSPHLYELLRSALQPSGPPSAPAPNAAVSGEGGPQPSLQERLAAYKAAKLAAVPPAAPSSQGTFAPVVTAPPPAPAAPAVAEPSASTSVGERVIRITYNTAVFAGLVAVGLLFIAYSIGVRSGRARAAETGAEAPVANPPVPPKVYSIRLAEWPAGTSQQRLNASYAQADGLKTALDRAGLRGAEKVEYLRGNERYVALHWGRFNEISPDVRAKLKEFRAFKSQNQLPFAKADFEELAK